MKYLKFFSNICFFIDLAIIILIGSLVLNPELAAHLPTLVIGAWEFNPTLPNLGMLTFILTFLGTPPDAWIPSNFKSKLKA